jgi:transposase
MATPKLAELKRELIEHYLREGKTHREIAKAVGVSQGTVGNIAADIPVEERTKVDVASRAVADQRDEWKAKYEDAIRQLQQRQEELDLRRSLAEYQKFLAPIGIDIKKNHTKHDATPIIVASDWHGDEVIDPASINGVNEFNAAVFTSRSKRFWKYAAKLVKILSQDSDIDTVVLALLGDFMSGWIHPDLIQTNSCTPPEMILRLLDNFTGGLEFLLKELPDKKIHIVGAVGNHSRITIKPEHKNRVGKSYEGLLYELLMRYFSAKGEKRIVWQLPTGYFNWMTLYGKRIRFHHGDSIKYQGGVGGIEIPLRKAIAAWNRAQSADLDVMGHWHQRLTGSSYIVNGSLVGYSQFSEAIKCDYETARQACFLLHSRWGKTAEYPIVVQDDPR